MSDETTAQEKEKKPEILGLKKLRQFNEDGTPKQRQPNWKKPNRKAAANLKRRQDDFDKNLANCDKNSTGGFKRPGSMKVPR